MSDASPDQPGIGGGTRPPLGSVGGGVAPRHGQVDRDDVVAVVKTYRYLRGGLAAAVVLLAVAIVKSAIENDCLQTSISAYYYTPVRPILVGVLMILGFGLIVLRGASTVEDVLLNIAGMLAPIVAIMPTTDVGTCAIIQPNVDPVVDGKLAGWVVANVDNNLWAFMITGLVGVVATAAVGCGAVLIARRQGGTSDMLTRPAGVGLAVVGGLLVLSVIIYAAAPEWSRSHAHGWSALAMFGFLGVAALVNSRSLRRSLRYRWIYLGTAVAMAIFAMLCFAALRGIDHQILVLEAGEILLFAGYWIVQTIEYWGSPSPRHPGVDAAQLGQPASGGRSRGAWPWVQQAGTPGP